MATSELPMSAPELRGGAARVQKRLIRIDSAGGLSLGVRELWAYRELLFFLVWRDVKVRYKQTALGIAWAVIQPFTAMVLFSVIFGKLAGIKPGSNDPYPLFVYAGLLPWQYFTSCLTQSGSSVVGNSQLVKKVYFPRLLLPLGSMVVPVVDFLFSFLILVGMFFWYGRTPSWHVIAVPLLLGLTLTSAFGVGLWLSALNVRYHDVKYIMTYLTMVWMYVTPVIYPSTLIPQHYRWLVSLNPMAGAIDGFRWAVLGHHSPSILGYGLSVGVSIGLVAGGLWYFRRMEARFADVI